jgi:hypothetical protein
MSDGAIILLALFALPTAIAVMRGHQSVLAIAFINAFGFVLSLYFTPLAGLAGWLIAMVWALAAVRRRRRLSALQRWEGKRVVIWFALMMVLTGASQAWAAAPGYELDCDAPSVMIGDDTRDDPVIGVRIFYTPDEHAWRVLHVMSTGLIVSRGAQYGIMDATNDHRVQWQGALIRKPSIYMIGELQRGKDGGVSYMEWIYDRAKNNALVMQSIAKCFKPTPPLPRPTM